MSFLAILAAMAPSLLPAAATIASGIMGNQAVKEANKKSLAIYEKELAEEIKNNAILAGQNQEQINMQRQSMLWQKEQQEAENKRIKEETNYNRLQTAADKIAQYRNSKQALKVTNMSGFQRG